MHRASSLPVCVCVCVVQTRELEYATKYYAAILARATGKTLTQCQEQYLSRKR
jgi:ATP-dependent Clp protease protease subunit